MTIPKFNPTKFSEEVTKMHETVEPTSGEKTGTLTRKIIAGWEKFVHAVTHHFEMKSRQQRFADSLIKNLTNVNKELNSLDINEKNNLKKEMYKQIEKIKKIVNKIDKKPEKISETNLSNLRQELTNLEKNLGITKKEFTVKQNELLKDMKNQLKTLGFGKISEGFYFDDNDELQICLEIIEMDLRLEPSIIKEVGMFYKSGSAATEADLYAGAKILAVEDQKVQSPEELLIAFYNHIDKQEIQLEKQEIEKHKPIIAPVKIKMIPANPGEGKKAEAYMKKDALERGGLLKDAKIEDAIIKDFDLTYLAIYQKQKNNPQKNINEV